MLDSCSHMQCIKLLYAEGKKGSTLLYYIAGGRVLRYLSRAFANERTLTKLLRWRFCAGGLAYCIYSIKRHSVHSRAEFKLRNSRTCSIAKWLQGVWVAFILLVVDVGGSVYSRVAFIQGRRLINSMYTLTLSYLVPHTLTVFLSMSMQQLSKSCRSRPARAQRSPGISCGRLPSCWLCSTCLPPLPTPWPASTGEHLLWRHRERGAMFICCLRTERSTVSHSSPPVSGMMGTASL